MRWKELGFDHKWVESQLGVSRYSMKQHSNSIDIYYETVIQYAIGPGALYLPFYLKHKKIKLIKVSV